MVPRLKEVDAVVADEIDDAVLLGEAARPDSGAEVLQWLGLPQALEGVAENRLDEVEGPEGDAAVRVDPEPEVFEELLLEDSFAAALRRRTHVSGRYQVPFPGGGSRSSAANPCDAARAPTRAEGARHFSGTSGDEPFP